MSAGKIVFGLFSVTYIGQRKGGEPHGYGIEEYYEKVYIGEWENGRAHGFGISDIGYERHTQYELLFQQNINDQGLLKDHRRMLITIEENGFDIYIGEFVDLDNLHGYVTWVSYEGDMYVGHWEHGQPHGQGTHIYADGTVESGQWEAGKYVGP